MVFITRKSIYRWRPKRNSRKTKKLSPTSNIAVKTSLQFSSQSARESSSIGSHDYERVPILKKCFVTREKRTEKKIFGKSEKILKFKSNVGPGSYDIGQWPEIILNKTGNNARQNLGFGTTSRFYKRVKFSTPGPGYVGVDHNPYYFIENKRKRGLSPLPTFEYDGLAPRIKKKKSFSLAPNRYRFQHPDSLESFLKKKTGKRGPYDLFTGPRDYSSIKGYFSLPIIFETSDWPKKLPGEIEKLLHKSNNFKGVFGKSSRFGKSSKTTIQPGPGEYDVEKLKKVKIMKNCPFGKSLEREKKLGNMEVHPSPGQYDVKIKKIIPGSGWTSVFKSKVPRIKSLAKEPYNNF